jgi:hypothetical protein
VGVFPVDAHAGDRFDALAEIERQDWSSLKALPQRVPSLWSIAAAADKSPRSAPLAVSARFQARPPPSARRLEA